MNTLFIYNVSHTHSSHLNLMKLYLHNLYKYKRIMSRTHYLGTKKSHTHFRAIAWLNSLGAELLVISGLGSLGHEHQLAYPDVAL